MTGFDIVFYAAVAFAALFVGGLIFPNPFRARLRELVGIKVGEAIDGATKEIERIRYRVAQLEKGIADNKRKASDLRGSLNHAKNKVGEAKTGLSGAEADYKFALEQNLSDTAKNEALDKVAEAEANLKLAQEHHDAVQTAADAARLAVADAAREIQQLQSKVKSAEVRDSAARVLKDAADMLETTKDIGKATGELGKDLDKVNEKYEQAKQRLEDAKGSAGERELEEAKRKRERDEIRRRIEERQGKTS